MRVHSLNPPPKTRTFRAAGGNRKFKLIKSKQFTRKVIIVAKSRKKASKNTDLVDEDLEELEELEELDDLDDEDEDEPDDEEDEDDEEDDEDEDDDDLSSKNVKELRAMAREAGIAVKGLNKDGLIEAIEAGPEEDDDEDEDEEEEEDDEDDEEEEDEEPTPKRGRSKKSTKAPTSKKKKSTPSKSRTTDGKVGVAEVAEAAGTDGRKLRMVLRKHKIEKDEDVGRYEWSSLNHPEVKKILKLVKGGAVKDATKESLEKLNAKKGKTTKSRRTKTTDAPRKKSSGTTGKKRRSSR